MRNSNEISQDLAGKVQELNAASDNSARTSLSQEVRNLTVELNSAKAAEKAECALAGNKKEQKELHKYSIAKAIREAAYGHLTGFEAEMDAEARKEFERSGRSVTGFGIPSVLLRATYQNVSTTGEGAEFAATTEWSYVEALRNNLVGTKVGVRYLNGLQGNVRFVKGAGTTASWLSEESAAAVQKPGYSSVDMTPHRLQVLTGYTNDLLKQSALPVEDLIWDDIVKAHASALDAAIFSGTGTSGQPKGIINTTGVLNPVANSTAAALTYAQLVSLETAMAAANGLYGNISLVTNAAVYGSMKTTPQVAGYPLYLVTDKKANGYNVEVTEGVTSGYAVMGNFSEVIVGQWGGLDLIVDPYTAKNKAVIEVTAYAYHDVAVRQPAAFAIASGLK